MNVSKTVEHGFYVIGYIAKYGNDDYVSASTIAKKYDIAAASLGTITKKLLRANILKNKMGPRGGFKLTKPANKITMLDVLEAIEGPLEQLIKTGRETKDEPFMANMETTCENIIAKAKDSLQKAKISKMIKE